VLRVFARLQIRSVGFVDQLHAAGCLDRTPQWLAHQATEWLSFVGLSQWLSDDEAAELRAAGPDLALTCAELTELPVPLTIGHGDMHLGNTARGVDGYLFFDWTDACITHPFVDMIAIFLEDDPVTRQRLRDDYLAEWTPFASSRQLTRAWSLAEPLVWLNQAISYTSIVSHQEPGWDRDGFGAATGRWLRRLLDWSRI
jgi:hypothetical protein